MPRVALWDAFDPLMRTLGQREESDVVRALIDLHGLVPDEVDGTTYWEATAFGIALRSEDDVVDTVFLYGQGKDDCAEYQGRLPTGIAFACDRAAVRRYAGMPTRCSSGAHEWDRYDAEGKYVHFMYEGNPLGVSLITIGLARGPMGH